MGKCYFCTTECDHQRDASKRGGSDFFRCPNCGSYYTIDFFKSDIDSNKHMIAGYLYEIKDDNEIPELDTEYIQKILNSPKIPKTTIQRLEKLLLYFYKQNEYIGQEYTFTTQNQTVPPSVAYAKSVKEIFNMIIEMNNIGWIQLISQNNAVLKFCLVTRGLTYAEQLMTTNIDSKKVFIAMKFNDEMYKVVDNAMRPALESCGFVAFPVYDKEHNNDINDEIIAGIKTSKFMISDFTYSSYGAYFEAGYAQGMGLEVIRTCSMDWLNMENENGEKNKLHFDVEHYSFIIWEDYEDLIKKLKNRIRATISGAVMTDEAGDGNV